MTTLTTYYSTPADVITRTGAKPDDMGLDDDEELETFIEGLLVEASDIVTRKLGRDYLALLDRGVITEIPAGLNGIVADVVADSMRTMLATRQSAVVRIDDFAVATLRSRMLSPDVLDRLRLYGHQGHRSIRMGNR
jgi:hypothetical protein